MIEKFSAENACDAARYIMTEYYRLNVEPFFSVLSQNCVWILPGGQIVIGAEAIRAMFQDGFIMPPFQAEGEVFPVQISRQTYHYVQKLLQESGRAPNRRIIIKAENATYSFDPDMVLYVEAIGKVCTVYMMNRTMVIRQPITALETQFPKQFCRIHRSYLVNCRFVLQVERYAVTLINGTVLPIPAKRYMEVREEITTLIK